MAEKWERLVDALGHADGWTTASELADRLGVTTRTIRNYAAQANSGGVIVESGPAGYRLDRAAWANRAAPARRDSSPQVRAARVIRSLIDATDGLDVHETAAANHVSDSTFEADLGRVRARLDGTGLTLVRQGPRITLEGPETARRRLLGALFRDESARGMLELDQLRAAFPEVTEFRTALVAGLADAGYAPNEYGLNDVLLHTAIALDRVATNHPLDEAEAAAPPASSSASTTPAAASAAPAPDAPAGPLAELLARLVDEHFGTSVGPADLAHLTRLLETRAATRTTAAAQADAPGRPISPRVPLVRRIVARASAAYLVDLDDEDFIDRLALHVDNLVARASTSTLSRNPLTASIKAAYPLIYELAVYIASELARTEGIAVDDDEIAYIAMHVGAYLDQRRSRGEIVRVAVSAPAYHDVHTALAARIRSAVDDEVEVLAPGDEAERADVLVAVIEPSSPVERLVLVAPFPTEVDLERVRAEIARVRRARRRARLAASLSRYIAPELFVRGLRGLDRDAAIRMLGDRMISAGVIDRSYVEGALERERLSSTAFTEHLAVPHAMTMTARRTAIAIAIDDVPIDWGGASVNVVALIAFAESGRAEFQEVFDQFVEAFSERENVQRLVVGAMDYPGLLAELSRLMEPHAA
ncbi:BglG family transcription antiterminator [Agromyces mariniharenae]|uniref:PRD domain-containing protein n=1 Tax=Agromyces mariniharenae TaxID=2604423 RepID=A0A5S4V5M7_9MICO|nr:PTS sugar transporter subunit IIA [Agromyces mariniharenae]TYL54292.1 PRD domain-containing protein [Agromyces mariniharenae]